MPAHAVRPRVAQQLLETLQRTQRKAARTGVHLHIYVSVTKHLGNYPPEQYPTCVSRKENGAESFCQQFLFDTNTLESIFNEVNIGENGESFLHVQLLRSPDTESMVRALPAWVPLLHRTIVRAP
jgi:hypothetical protein